MRTGAAILGIIGGAIALIIGAISFTIGDFSQSLGIGDGLTRQILSIGLPAAALIGGGIVRKLPILAGILMLGSAIAILVLMQFSIFSIMAGLPIGLGGIFAFIGAGADSKEL